ncbi:hypothetical protein [Nonomuraea typhae]|uniref:hypothetical protein n=1 Tax=Nonomuraea typhae TaxID=2603600 RepID=UPI0012FB22CB|nr:hypothetical protein [Nonomuraea typhae]
MFGRRRPRGVAAAVGAGALMLATLSTVTAAMAGDVSLVFDRLDDPDRELGKWVRTGDVLRFRVRLAGKARDARLAVAASPGEALSTVACFPAPSPAPFPAPFPAPPAPASAGAVPSPSPSPFGSMLAGSTPPQVVVTRGAEVCRLGKVAGERAVDVLLTVPQGVTEVVLAAVAQVRGSSGLATLSGSARTAVGARLMDPAPSTAPAPPTDSAGVAAPPAKDAVGVVAPPAKDVAGVVAPRAKDAAGVVAPPAKDTAGTAVPPAPVTPPSAPAVPVRPGKSGEKATRQQNRGLATGKQGGGSAYQTGGMPSGGYAESGTSPYISGSVPPPVVAQPQQPATQPQQPAPPQGPGGDPNLRLPQAAPAPPAAGAPLPRQIAVAHRRLDPGKPLDLLTGPRGVPVTAGGIGVLLTALWLAARTQRRRIARSGG